MKTVQNDIKKFLISSWINKEQEKIIQTYIFKENFIGFKGHFPQNPILPAIIQILLAKICLQNLLKEKIKIKKIFKAKFLYPIKPNDKISLQCEKADSPLIYNCNIIIKNKLVTTFKLKLDKDR